MKNYRVISYLVALAKKQKETPWIPYIHRGQNTLQKIFKYHSADFKEQDDLNYAKLYGNYRIERISEILEEFLKCGYYMSYNQKHANKKYVEEYIR